VCSFPKIVESFPLTIVQISQKYNQLPTNAMDVCYHYTNHNGLEGILRSGEIRATYRLQMNDLGEFEYAKNIIYRTLQEIEKIKNLPPVALSLTEYTRKNLDNLISNSINRYTSYCACFTFSSDHIGQWTTYAEDGKGFAIGFNIYQFMVLQNRKTEKGEPCAQCNPVIYNEINQSDLVWSLFEAGLNDLQTFADNCSKNPLHLTALRDRITEEIISILLIRIDFIKAPEYKSEQEMRLILCPNDDTLHALNIQYYERDNQKIPFIVIDLRNPDTGRLFLEEIKVGPNAQFHEEEEYLENLLDELGYGNNFEDRPRIVKSLLEMDET